MKLFILWVLFVSKSSTTDIGSYDIGKVNEGQDPGRHARDLYRTNNAINPVRHAVITATPETATSTRARLLMFEAGLKRNKAVPGIDTFFQGLANDSRKNSSNKKSNDKDIGTDKKLRIDTASQSTLRTVEGLHTFSTMSSAQIDAQHGATTAKDVSNSRNNESSIKVVLLCGYPSYYRGEQCLSLYSKNSSLSNCESQIGLALFGSAIVLLALVIIFCNGLLPLAMWQQRDMRCKHNYIKVSLCFADMLLGFILLFSVLPNMFWFRNNSEMEVVKAITESSSNSPAAVTGGALLYASAQASLMHLTFLSVERFIAIAWPLWYRGRRTSTVIYTMAAIWTLSLLFAFIPAAFRDKFEFTFIPVIFVYMLTTKGSSGYQGLIFASLSLLIPYIAAVAFSLLTVAVAWKKLAYSQIRKNSPDISKRKPTSPVSSRGLTPESQLKPELAVFKTILLMITAFTVTLLPIFIVYIFFHAKYLDCATYSIPYTIAFYVSIANSFTNVIVYSVRDERFRCAVKSMFQKRESSKKSSEAAKYSRPI